MQRILLPQAAAFLSETAGSAGDIVVLEGLRHSRAGDTLHGLLPTPGLGLRPFEFALLFQNSGGQLSLRDKKGEQHATKAVAETLRENESAEFVQSADALYETLRQAQLRQQHKVPVCFSSLDCAKRSDERQLEEALRHLRLQDPSLLYSRREGESLVLWGRGQLQLELVKDRLRTEFGGCCQATTGAADAALSACFLSTRGGRSCLQSNQVVVAAACAAAGVKTVETPTEIAYKEFLLEPLRGTLTHPPPSPTGSGQESSSFSLLLSLAVVPLPFLPAEERLAAIVKGEPDPWIDAIAKAAFEVVAGKEEPRAGQQLPLPKLRPLLGASAKRARGGALSSDSADEDCLPEQHHQAFVFFALSAETQAQIQTLNRAAHPSRGEELLEAVEAAASAALSAGPLACYPLDCLVLLVENLRVNAEAPPPPSVAAATTAKLLRQLLRGRDGAGNEAPAANAALLEPVMHLELFLPASCVGPVSADLSLRRQGHVVASQGEDANANATHSAETEASSTQTQTERFMELHATVGRSSTSF